MYFGCHSFCHSVITGSHFQVNIACSTAISLSPLIKRLLSIVLLYIESHTRYGKSRKLKKPFFGPTCLNLHFRRSVKGLKICQHIIIKMYV